MRASRGCVVVGPRSIITPPPVPPADSLCSSVATLRRHSWIAHGWDISCRILTHPVVTILRVHVGWSLESRRRSSPIHTPARLLIELHEKNIVHLGVLQQKCLVSFHTNHILDIKSSNILIDYGADVTEIIKAQLGHLGSSYPASLPTNKGMGHSGSFAYMVPEVRMEVPWTEMVDIWASATVTSIY